MQYLNERFDSLIEKQMRKHAKKNKNALDSELIQKIGCTDTYTNSISVAVGRQRSGKTRKILKEIIKITNVHKNTHMLFYVNKTGQKTDKTFESMKGLIKVPIVYLSQAECEERLVELIQYKNQYNQIKQLHREDEIPDEVCEELFDALGIEDFSKPYLHTLILLDDIANSSMLAKPTSIMNSLMTQCAHINCSFFLAIQFWKGLPASIKSQVTTIYMFGGFSREQLHYILRQITLQSPFSTVFEEYKKLGYQDYMHIDVVESHYTICTRKQNALDDSDDSDDDDDTSCDESVEEKYEDNNNDNYVNEIQSQPISQMQPEYLEMQQMPQIQQVYSQQMYQNYMPVDSYAQRYIYY